MSQRAVELRGRVELLLDRLGYELLELRLQARGRATCLQVLIDHLEAGSAVTVGDCVTVSRALDADLELGNLLPERHVLEVSSPGVDRPLTRPAHFRRFTGERAVVRWRVSDAGRRTLTGAIETVDGDESVTLIAARDERVQVPFREIESAHLKVDPWKPKRQKP